MSIKYNRVPLIHITSRFAIASGRVQSSLSQKFSGGIYVASIGIRKRLSFWIVRRRSDAHYGKYLSVAVSSEYYPYGTATTNFILSWHHLYQQKTFLFIAFYFSFSEFLCRKYINYVPEGRSTRRTFSKHSLLLQDHIFLDNKQSTHLLD